MSSGFKYVQSSGKVGNTYLWYIPNRAEAGHRGDEAREDHNSLETLTEHALAAERNGFSGALLGAGWHRPDTFTLGTALAARTSAFQPLIAARPGYWHPAHFAAAAATLDRLSQGRALVNIVSGADDLASYGDAVSSRFDRYARTREFLQLLRRLWTEDSVTYRGEHYTVEDATLSQKPVDLPGRPHPTLYFGGASAEAEEVAAAEADVQLFWGESLARIEERIRRLRQLSEETGREHADLEFGLRITTVVRDTSEEAWAAARERHEGIVARQAGTWNEGHGSSEGQRHLVEQAREADVVDGSLYTAPAALGAQGAGGSWLVGSPQEVAAALARYHALGVTHFILSDTPYLTEVERIGTQVLPRLDELTALKEAAL